MIVLTGASGGIGQGIINHLCKIDDVIGIFNSTEPEPTDNNRIIFEQVDIECPAAVEKFAGKFKKELSEITVIHCAASNADGLAANLDLSKWDHVLGVNLRSNFILCQTLLPQMIAEKWGRIIHISSHRGLEGAPGTIAYATSKTGLIGMSKVLAREYARFNITSNVLVLGAFETGLYYNLTEIEKQLILDKIPAKKFGDLTNISNAVEFIIKSGYVNASTINIDGAW
jgi:3-oxoacyl-[acyl-carrier protein] reductase